MKIKAYSHHSICFWVLWQTVLWLKKNSGSTDVGLIGSKTWYSFSRLFGLFLQPRKDQFLFHNLWSDLLFCRNNFCALIKWLIKLWCLNHLHLYNGAQIVLWCLLSLVSFLWIVTSWNWMYMIIDLVKFAFLKNRIFCKLILKWKGTNNFCIELQLENEQTNNSF